MTKFDAQPGRAQPAPPDLTAAQLEVDELDLHAAVAGVAAIVAGARGVPEMLGSVAQFAIQAIPGVDGAGITLMGSGDGGPHIETLSVTADFVRDIDTVQYDELGEGPCLSCLDSGRTTVSGALGSDDRWPRFGARVAGMGVHSVLALPLTVGDTVIGAINAYARARDVFGEHAVQLASDFAGPAAVAVYNAHLLDQTQERTQRLQRALQSRAVIDQAIGIIRSRSGDDAAAAFDRLVRISQSENIKLSVVAERLVEESVRRARVRRR